MKYSFSTNTLSENEDTQLGDFRIVFDLKKLIVDRLGFQPAYHHRNHDAWYDESNLVVGINDFLDRIPKERYIRICINNDQLLGGMGFSHCDVLIEPDFNPMPQNIRNTASHATFFTIRALPSRCTPISIKAAAKEYCDRSNFKSTRQPITAFLVGSLWPLNPFGELTPKQSSLAFSKTLDQLRKFFKKRGGSILLSTSRRTGSNDSKMVIDRLKPWIVDSYTFSDESKPNPYTAFLGLADEIMVSGDSLSMMSDAVGTEKPIRIIHHEDLSCYSRNEPRPIDFTGQCIDMVPYMINGLVRAGAKELSDDHRIGPSPKFDTGLSKAVDHICELIRRKSALLELNRE